MLKEQEGRLVLKSGKSREWAQGLSAPPPLFLRAETDRKALYSKRLRKQEGLSRPLVAKKGKATQQNPVFVDQTTQTLKDYCASASPVHHHIRLPAGNLSTR